MATTLQPWLFATLASCALLAAAPVFASPLRISGAQITGSQHALTGVFRSTYKEARPVRSAARNLALAEATGAKNDARVSRSSHQTPLLVARLLQEHAVPVHEDTTERTPSTHTEQRVRIQQSVHEDAVERTPSTHTEQRVTMHHSVHENAVERTLSTHTEQRDVELEGVAEPDDVQVVRTLHPRSPLEDGDDSSEQPFSYQQYHIDTSRGEHETHQDDDGDHGGKGAKPGEAAERYEFVYQVAGGHHGEGDFGHAERRDAAGVTWGRYYVHQPDGRVKTVRYWADHTGYHADVNYHAEPAEAGQEDAVEEVTEEHQETHDTTEQREQ